MPVARYFFFVGGVLLALLFALDAVLPKLPVADQREAGIELPGSGFTRTGNGRRPSFSIPVSPPSFLPSLRRQRRLFPSRQRSPAFQ